MPRYGSNGFPGALTEYSPAGHKDRDKSAGLQVGWWTALLAIKANFPTKASASAAPRRGCISSNPSRNRMRRTLRHYGHPLNTPSDGYCMLPVPSNGRQDGNAVQQLCPDPPAVMAPRSHWSRLHTAHHEYPRWRDIPAWRRPSCAQPATSSKRRGHQIAHIMLASDVRCTCPTRSNAL